MLRCGYVCVPVSSFTSFHIRSHWFSVVASASSITINIGITIQHHHCCCCSDCHLRESSSSSSSSSSFQLKSSIGVGFCRPMILLLYRISNWHTSTSTKYYNPFCGLKSIYVFTCTQLAISTFSIHSLSQPFSVVIWNNWLAHSQVCFIHLPMRLDLIFWFSQWISSSSSSLRVVVVVAWIFRGFWGFLGF